MRSRLRSLYTCLRNFKVHGQTIITLVQGNPTERTTSEDRSENRFGSCSFTGPAFSLNSLRGIPSRRAKEIRLVGRDGALKAVNHKNTRDYKRDDDDRRGNTEKGSPGCTLSFTGVYEHSRWIILHEPAWYHFDPTWKHLAWAVREGRSWPRLLVSTLWFLVSHSAEREKERVTGWRGWMGPSRACNPALFASRTDPATLSRDRGWRPKGIIFGNG